METTTWLLLIDITAWLGLFFVSLIRIEQPPFSEFELKRRAESGDQEAAVQYQRRQLLPRFFALKQVIHTVLAILAVALALASLGWIVGSVVAFVLLLSLAPLTRFAPAVRLVRRVYSPYESRLFERLRVWGWLDTVRSFTDAPVEYAATSRIELYHMIERSAAVLGRDELLRFQASRAFDEHTVEDVMTPVSVVDLVTVTDPLGPLVLDGLHKTGHSRFPVMDQDIHHIVGILYLHDIINLKSAKSMVREAMDPRVHYIHEKQSLEQALHGFLKTHHHLFVVVNDYRETVGVLTLEDVLEALVGKKIVDEFDRFEDLRAVAESNPRKNNLPKGKSDI